MIPADTRRVVEQNTKRIRESERRAALFWERRRVPWPLIHGGSGDSPGTGVKLETLCVHGDTPDAAAIATTVREALVAAGIHLQPSLLP